MEYIVLSKDDNKEYGPVDADTLRKWVEHGRVFKDTQVRNSLMKKWNEAGTMDILDGAFDVQDVHEEDEEGVGGKLMGMFGLKKEHEVTQERDIKTAFKQKYLPFPASAGQRVGAFAIDAFLIACFAFVLFLFMNWTSGTFGLGDFSLGTSDATEEVIDESSDEIPTDTAVEENVADTKIKDEDDEEEKIEKEKIETPFFVTEETQINAAGLNQSFKNYFTFFVTVVMLYYGIGLGLFAQTGGMWFWGIIIVKGYDKAVFPARAFAFTIAMFVVGIVTPVVVLLNPKRRSLQGYLTGTRLIRVAAKSK